MLYPPFFQEYTPLNRLIRLYFVVPICYNLLAFTEKKWIPFLSIFLFINIAHTHIFISSDRNKFINHTGYL